MLTNDQLTEYFNHIRCPAPASKEPSLQFLTTLQKYHLARVPFENLSLHYSKHHLLSLDQDDLYSKIVHRGMGGYCMENNAFFGTVLRSLGFAVFSTGARVSNVTVGRPGGGFLGWNHMINIVTIGGQRYLVDVGFGHEEPTLPLPLISGHTCQGIGSQSWKLEYIKTPQHTDASQRTWVFSHRESDEAAWIPGYSFTEIEFFPEDFEVMNLSTMSLPQSFFTQALMCVRAFLSEENGEFEGFLILFHNEVKRRKGGVIEVVQTLKNEEQRVKALQDWFGIVLNEGEQKGIRGLATELREKPSVAVRSN